MSGPIYAGSFVDDVRFRAEQGDKEAQATLGYLYESGRGVAKDPEQARRWYERATQKSSSGVRQSPRRPSAVSSLSWERPYERPRRLVENYSKIRSGVAAYEKARTYKRRTQRLYSPLTVGGKILVSPITFTFKQSKKLIDSLARRAAIGGLAYY